MNTAQLHPVLVEKFAQALVGVSSEQIENLIHDRARLKVAVVATRSAPAAAISEDDLGASVDRLRSMVDRSEGGAYLATLSKPVLLALAKKTGLSVDGSTAKDKLIERLVERVIGLRLRQEAFAQLR